MSIQTTSRLSRETAEYMYVAKELKADEAMLKEEAKLFSNEDLENEIESRFENYIIDKD